MNFKALAARMNDARTYAAIEHRLMNTADATYDASKKRSIVAKANLYGIEARKAQGEVSAIIFGYQHYKGADVMERQAAVNPCYQ